MSMQLHFSRSPLTEAVIDLRVKLPESTPVNVLTKVQAGLETEYPIRNNHFQGRVEVTVEDEITAAGTGSHNGYIFSSSDERQIFQARLDGFTFSRLAPYEHWESFRSEARRLWNIYRAVTRLETITRVAVRYINRLDLPLPVSDLKEYLKTLPEVSVELPYHAISGYVMQLHIPQPDIEGILILNEGLVSPPTPDVVSVLLDIDLFRETNIPTDEEELWAFFEQIRVRKNEIFLGCITSRTKELIA